MTLNAAAAVAAADGVELGCRAEASDISLGAPMRMAFMTVVQFENCSSTLRRLKRK